ncbi:MAG TPA: hypothetical protein EYP63_01890 [Desulfotomaculum sp.]|nr:hypothetical protein [Desulfotomaculum sp.]
MVYVFLVVLFYAVVSYFEVPRMLKHNMRREFYTFIAVCILGFVLAAGQILDLPLPNVMKGIETVVRPVYKAVEGLLLPPELRP